MTERTAPASNSDSADLQAAPRSETPAAAPVRGAIILGVEYQALGLLRQLRETGTPCVLVDQDRWGAALFSKYRAEHYQSPAYISEQFWPWLVNLAKTKGYEGWALIPTDDEQVRQIALHWEEARSVFSVLGMPWEGYQVIYNKRINYEWCLRNGIPTPRSYLPIRRDDYPEQLATPFIVKPAFRQTYSSYCKAKAIPVKSRAELENVLNTTLKCVPIEELLYQEIISGSGENQWSYAGLFEAGRPIAAFTARRRRQHPPDFGRASTYVEAIHEPEVEKQSLRVLSLLNYTGLAEVEWKRDSRTGELKFLEVNARSWGWHSLSTKVVGNLPAMFMKQVTGQHLPTVTPKYGHRWVKHITDLPVVVDMMRRGDLRFKDYIQSLRGAVMGCEWAGNDPVPFFLQFLLVTYLMKKRGY